MTKSWRFNAVEQNSMLITVSVVHLPCAFAMRTLLQAISSGCAIMEFNSSFTMWYVIATFLTNHHHNHSVYECLSHNGAYAGLRQVPPRVQGIRRCHLDSQHVRRTPPLYQIFHRCNPHVLFHAVVSVIRCTFPYTYRHVLETLFTPMKLCDTHESRHRTRA